MPFSDIREYSLSWIPASAGMTNGRIFRKKLEYY
jgi:hypothetical protein